MVCKLYHTLVYFYQQVHKGGCNHFFPQNFISFFLLFLVGTGCVSTFMELSGPVCKSTWNGYPSYSLLTSISRFVIDFLSIRKVIIFSAIATDGRHPLRSRSIHQYAANCITIRFRYIAQSRGYGKPTAHAHVIMFDALPVGRTACQVRR